MFHVKHAMRGIELLPDTKPAKQCIQHIFGGGATNQPVKRNPASSQLFACQQWILLIGRLRQRFSQFGQASMLSFIKR